MGFCLCRWFCLLVVFAQAEPALTTSTILFVEADFVVVASLERVVLEERSIEDLGTLVENPTAVVVAPARELAVLAVPVPIAVVAVDRGPEACSVSAVGLAVPAVASADEAVVASAEIAHTVSAALVVAMGFLAEVVVVGLAIVGHLAVPVSGAGCSRGPSWSRLRSLRPS